MNTTTDLRIEVNPAQILRFAPWIALGLGFVLLLVGFSGKEYGYLIAACFFGIVARIAQAEHHRREGMNTRSGSA